MAWTVSWGDSPVITFDLSYEARRLFGEQQYQVTVSCNPCYGDHYFGYPIYLEIKLDGATVATHTLKAASPNRWTSAITYTTDWLTVLNKTSGVTNFSIRIYSGSGSTRNKTYTSWFIVSPAPSKISATDMIIGGMYSISITKYVSGYTTTINYRAEGQSIYTTLLDKVPDANWVGYFPDSLWSLYPTNPEIKIDLACITYDGDTVVGIDETTITAYATASKCGPLMGISSRVIDPESKALTGSDKRIINRVSTVRVIASAAGRYGATITDCKIYCGGRSVDQPQDGRGVPFEKVGLGGVYAIATDSRGLTTRIDDTTLEYLLYSVPTMVPTITRDTPTGDTVTVSVRGSWYNGTFGPNPNSEYKNGIPNTLTVRARYKATTAESYGDYVDIPVTVSGNEFLATAEVSGVSYNSVYSFQIRLDDAVCNDDSGALGSIYSTVQVSKGIPIFDWGEDDFNFNVPVTIKGLAIFRCLGDYIGLDLNDLKNANGWYIGASAPTVARGCLNFPNDSTGMLTVFGMGSFAYQTYYTYDGRVFSRAYYEVSGWSAWKQLQMV